MERDPVEDQNVACGFFQPVDDDANVDKTIAVATYLFQHAVGPSLMRIEVWMTTKLVHVSWNT